MCAGAFSDAAAAWWRVLPNTGIVSPGQASTLPQVSDTPTIWFVDVSLVIVVPVVISYQVHARWVFRSKIEDPAGHGGHPGPLLNRLS